MKVLFVTPYFPPELGAAQARIYESVVRLKKKGHDVSVLTTFPSYPSGIVPLEWRGKFFWRGTDQGVRVYRIWSYAAPHSGFLKRLAGQLTYAFLACFAALLLPRHDAMIIESPPLFDGLVGIVARALRGVPYLFTVADLWPEAAIQLGVLHNRALIWLSEALELFIYRRSAAVLSITAGIRDKIIARGIDRTKVRLVRNSVDLQFFRPGLDASELKQTIVDGERNFVVLYAGTFGMTQNLDVVLDAAAQCKANDNRHIQFVLAGEGGERERLESKAKQMGLSNVRFLKPVSRSDMPALLNVADCVVVPVRDLELFSAALPTKLFEAMACAKPIVLAMKGEAAEIVTEAQAGICVAPDNPIALHNAIVKIQNSPESAARLGENGRRYAMQHFDRDRRTAEVDDLLREITTPRKDKLTASGVTVGQVE